MQYTDCLLSGTKYRSHLETIVIFEYFDSDTIFPFPPNFHFSNVNARMAELADALASGASGRKAVGVQLPLRAQRAGFQSRPAGSRSRPLKGDGQLLHVFPCPANGGIPGTKKRLIIQAFSICPLSDHLPSVASRSRL